MANIRKVPALIGLGSNLGEPITQLHHAIQAFHRHPHIDVVSVSPFYENPPMGPIAQPHFINAVMVIRTTLAPHPLLHWLQSQETAQGRVRTETWGPRTLDLDLLTYAHCYHRDPELILPHPGLYTRLFVLIPLHAIDPDWQLPSGQTVAEHLACWPDSLKRTIRLIAPAPDWH